MKQHPTFDYVIVGAGPSAMGLLYGILSSYYDTDDENASKYNANNNSSKKPMVSIAVIERGNFGGCINGGSPNGTKTSAPPTATTSNTNTKSAAPPAPLPPPPKSSSNFISRPSHWYKTAHDKHENVIHHPMLLKGNRRF